MEAATWLDSSPAVSTLVPGPAAVSTLVPGPAAVSTLVPGPVLPAPTLVTHVPHFSPSRQQEGGVLCGCGARQRQRHGPQAQAQAPLLAWLPPEQRGKFWRIEAQA
eukprot:357759-Chlamydomonas_euryale.AAC.6